MKKLINYTFISAIITMIFVVGSCTNPLIDTNLKNEGGEGTFALQIAVPNYDLHFTQDIGTKVVSPDSKVIAVYFDEDLAYPQEYPSWNNNLYNDWNASNASNGFFYTLYEQAINVKAGFYPRIRVELLNDWPGSGVVITKGEAYDVTVAPFPAEPTEVHITLTPPEGMFTPLTVGDAPYDDWVDYQGMKFYSFDAAAYTGYNLTITPTYGEPDVYLFNTQGLRTGLEIGHDIIYTADPDGIVLPGLATTMSIYKEVIPRTYYIGVYGWRDMANFAITIAVNPTATYRPSLPPPPEPTEVELLVSDAIAALKDNPDGRPDFNVALQKFTEAYLEDPGYGPAFAGYNALYAMKMMTDPDIVYTAREILGLQDYASNMTELFNAEWLQVYTTPQGWDNILPRIREQSDTNGDGIIDPYERMVAFMDWFIHHSDGFGNVADVALAKLGDRLDFAIQQILAMDPGMSMTFTWDMIYEDFERDVVSYEPGWYDDPDRISYRWPVDEHGSPVPVKIGKAELLTLCSVLKVVESFINIGKAYEYNLIDPLSGENVLVDYWTDFNPVDGTGAPGMYESDVTPFETLFLTPRDGAMLSIDAARFSFLDGLDLLQAAVFEMQADVRGEGFVISSTSPMPGIGGIDWWRTQDMLAFAIKAISEARASINDPAYTFIVPINFDPEMGYDFGWYAYGNWPTAIVSGDSAGVNLGMFFANPMAFLLELGSDGEPVWYEFTPYPEYFTPVTSVDPSFGGELFVKIPDLTLGGVIPVGDLQYIPVDDPNTRARLEGLDWGDWGSGIPENDNNYMWEPGETIWYAEISPAIEGVVDVYTQPLDFLYPFGDPFWWYEIVNADSLTDVDLFNWGKVAPEYFADFRAALNATGSLWVNGIDSLLFLDNTAFYFMVPVEYAWNSLSSPGDTEFDEEGWEIVSTGSIWWFFLNQIYNMGGGGGTVTSP